MTRCISCPQPAGYVVHRAGDPRVVLGTRELAGTPMLDHLAAQPRPWLVVADAMGRECRDCAAVRARANNRRDEIE